MSLLTNLVSYWKLDESSGTRADSHGSNDVAPTSAVGSTTGKIGLAATFSAKSSYLSRSSTTALSTRPMSVSFWLRISTLSIYDGPIGATNGVLWTQGWGVYWIGTTMYAFAGQWDVTPASVAVASPSSWNHVAVTWENGGVVRIYLNGVEGTAGATGSGALNAHAFTIGTIGDLGYATRGDIDEVGIWGRVLTSDEIVELYNAGTGLTYPFSVSAPSALYLPSEWW